jgi:hypothetical protein
MNKGQKIRMGLGIRLVMLVIGIGGFYALIAYINSSNKETTPGDVKTLADKKVDRFYIETDAKPLKSMQAPSNENNPSTQAP